MRDLFYSIDVEMTGDVAGVHPLLSIGACTLFNRDETFYAELKPTSFDHDIGNMKVACQGLVCIKPFLDQPAFQHYSPKFDAHAVLELLKEKGEAPEETMPRFVQWIKKTSDEQENHYRPVCVSTPLGNDWPFVHHYLWKYAKENPFGFWSRDLNAFYQGMVADPYASMRRMPGIERKEPAHNALEDALEQAAMYEQILKMALEKNPSLRRRFFWK